MLSMQTGESGDSGGSNRDEFLENASNDILNKISDR